MKLLANVLFFIFFSITSLARPVFFIGDIHADVDALKRILIGLKLVDQNLRWIGGDAELVTLGDHLDRGPNSRPVLDLLLRLEGESRATGGKVTNLIGNHEFLTADGHYTYAQAGDVLGYRDFKLGTRGTGYDYAFVGETVYAQWFRSRPAMYIVDDTLFVHAGVTEKMLDYSIDEINTMVLDWMRYVQINTQSKKQNKNALPIEAPHASTAWVIQGEGPLWTTKLSYREDTYKREKVNSHMLSVELLDRLLKHFNIKRVVVGHQPVEDMGKAVHHPVYGNRVVSADTGISVSDNKIVSGFKLENGIVTGFHFDRRSQVILSTVHSLPIENPIKNLCLSFY